MSVFSVLGQLPRSTLSTPHNLILVWKWHITLHCLKYELEISDNINLYNLKYNTIKYMNPERRFLIWFIVHLSLSYLNYKQTSEMRDTYVSSDIPNDWIILFRSSMFVRILYLNVAKTKRGNKLESDFRHHLWPHLICHTLICMSLSKAWR